MEDKGPGFAGSREWIGSVEVALVIGSQRSSLEGTGLDIALVINMNSIKLD